MTNSQENVPQSEAQHLEETKLAEQTAAANDSATQQNNVENREAQEEQSPATEGTKPQEQAAQLKEEPKEEAQQEAQAEAKEEPKRIYSTKKEVVERMEEIASMDELPQKDEVESLKTTFYKLHFQEREEQMKAYIDGGGDPEKYQILPDEDEEAFKREYTKVKELRQRHFLEMENQKAENLKKKLDIIEKIKAMTTTAEEANKNYQEFKALQQEFKDINPVPQEKSSELWRSYQLYVEQFYDLLKLNSELREYDFKKNLEIKNRLIEAAEKLSQESDVVSAFHQLQKLHSEYRETGPVAKDLREEVWNRFKAASTVVNKRHQQHFEELRSKEEENLQKKTLLCEKAEAIVAKEKKGAGDWEKCSKEIIATQAEWKTIGFAPQKMNVKIFERFRTSCDEFFAKKTEFFKSLKEQFAKNAEKKRQLIAQAEEMKDSTDWKVTGDKFVALQKEWKTIGAVPKRLSDDLWNQFLAACNHFFEAKKQVNQGERQEQKENLAKKREVIERIKALVEEAPDDASQKVHGLMDEYQAIGHVPFRDKDKVYKEYREAVDKVFSELNISRSRRNLESFRTSLKDVAQKGGNALDTERQRLVRRFEMMKQEVMNYENNLTFLNSKSKEGNSLIEEMNRKLQKLKDNLALEKEKIKALDKQRREAKDDQ